MTLLKTAGRSRQGITAFIASGYPLAFRLSNGEILLDADSNATPALPALGPAPSPGRRRLKLASTGMGEAPVVIGQRRQRGGRRSRALLQLTNPGAIVEIAQPASRRGFQPWIPTSQIGLFS